MFKINYTIKSIICHLCRCHHPERFLDKAGCAPQIKGKLSFPSLALPFRQQSKVSSVVQPVSFPLLTFECAVRTAHHLTAINSEHMLVKIGLCDRSHLTTIFSHLFSASDFTVIIYIPDGMQMLRFVRYPYFHDRLRCLQDCISYKWNRKEQ